MKHKFTMEYWIDDGWYVGKLNEVPGVFSQAETLEELEANIEDAYRMMMEEDVKINIPSSQTKELMVDLL